MKKVFVFTLVAIVLMLGLFGQRVQANSFDYTYLPVVVKEGVEFKPAYQSVGTSQKLIDAVPLSDGTIMVIYNTMNTPEGSYNLYADVYNPDGSFAMVSDFWQSSSGLISGAMVRNCGWVVSQGEFGFTVHKIVLRDWQGVVVEYGCGEPQIALDAPVSKNGK